MIELFHLFFGRIRGLQKVLSTLTDLKIIRSFEEMKETL